MRNISFKSIAAFAAIATGILFAGAQSANAASKITVQSGDTLSGLAATYNISIDSLQKANNIKDINKIFAGEVFVIGDDGQIKANPNNAAVKTATPAVPTEQAGAQTSKPQPVAQPKAQPAPQSNQQPAAVNNDGSMESIAKVESGGSYTARNGQYIGKYQLSASYLNGDYSPANQERVAREYAISRYGSIQNAVNFRASHNYW
ncbi:Aggregation promoting factor [Fructilactobacillus florum 8D]|uniref:Aggregation promoting factor n=1 Tax=Fructilactobacillus florum 8D TaxID=1221538 RepID=W9EFS8_9LACO|nr:LysM peptidoglycan-binding domain-containing protein [Fructilactobacillus florum]EKK20464.1 Aggregation promoting factor [Fructilactobacillus florum 2F]ETO40983.1 Aggregation promoting factor [Fructilactobacillus florum 8D]